MAEYDCCTLFGKPMVWQQRNEHDLTLDLIDEIDGMQNVVQFANRLFGMNLGNGTVCDKLHILYDGLKNVLPADAVRAAQLWVSDCEEILG
jgi:hypothetical protein